VTFKEKKGILGFMNGLRNSVDFRDSNKRLEVCAPYDPVHVQHVDFDSITGKLTILPGKRQEFLQDNHIFKHDQEKDSLATIEFSHGNDLNTMRYDALKVPRRPPHTLGMAPTVHPEVSKPIDDGLTSTGLRVPRFPRPLSDSLKLISLPLPKTGHARAHSSSGSQVLSPTLASITSPSHHHLRDPTSACSILSKHCRSRHTMTHPPVGTLLETALRNHGVCQSDRHDQPGNRTSGSTYSSATAAECGRSKLGEVRGDGRRRNKARQITLI
jgi:hypothetical protein